MIYFKYMFDILELSVLHKQRRQQSFLARLHQMRLPIDLWVISLNTDN